MCIFKKAVKWVKYAAFHPVFLFCAIYTKYLLIVDNFYNLKLRSGNRVYNLCILFIKSIEF